MTCEGGVSIELWQFLRDVQVRARHEYIFAVSYYGIIMRARGNSEKKRRRRANDDLVRQELQLQRRGVEAVEQEEGARGEKDCSPG